MKRAFAPLLATAMLALAAGPLRASDHLDGPATSEDAVVDLVDLYAFPTPGTPGSLTIILDVYPVVSATGHFSDQVGYTIHVRRAALRSGEQPGFETSDEVAIRCTFVTPDDHGAHLATCKTDAGVGATVEYDQTLPRAAGDGFHLFAGQRADPFFFNPVFAAAFTQQGKLITPRDQDIMKGSNTLALVIDVEVEQLFPGAGASLLAIAADSTTQDSSGATLQLDRIGRPEITNVTLAAHDDEPVLSDQYYADPTFAVPSDHASVYTERIAKNLAFFDGVDGHTDWRDRDRLALADLLVDDFLVVDISRPCEQPAYLEIERSLLADTPHQTCGGRKPTDDVMDTLFTVYAGGFAGAPIGDGVDQPSRAISTQFPYLAEPDRSLESVVKTTLVNRPGCGCHTQDRHDAGPAALSVLLGLALIRRRRTDRNRT